ncbi:MAG: carboxypeptidase-like regulatory domain-containing protein [Flavobacterium sp.]|nr:carboxypeptidase-like regulatory domain-containing protein [Flavobacterium sp.]
MKNNLLFLLLLIIQFSFSQTEIVVNGQVFDTDKKPVSGIEIINLVNEKSTISDKLGNFLILAKPDDMLVFSANEFDYKRKSLDQKDINENCLMIELAEHAVQLKNVVVYNYSKINAVSLGIISANVKSYAPAERRLLASNSLNALANTDGTTGGSISADPIFNFLSGRSKELKKQLEIEHKEKMLTRLKTLFINDFYVIKLKIKPDYIKAFQYYVIEDDDFISFTNANNRTAIGFRIIQLSEDFNKLQKNDK